MKAVEKQLKTQKALLALYKGYAPQWKAEIKHCEAVIEHCKELLKAAA